MRGPFLTATLSVMLASGASGCATIMEGSDQSILINTAPQGATCQLSRDGDSLSTVNQTPGSANVSKSKDDITVLCDKAGFERTSKQVESGFEGMTLGNLLVGGVIGVAIDAGSGAINDYPGEITIVLTPEQVDSFGATAQTEAWSQPDLELLEDAAPVAKDIGEADPQS
ncbi:MAG: hypothetical protein AAGM38_08160 [Pseudomonadota bacterium]